MVPDQGFAAYSKDQLAKLTGDKSAAQAFLRRHLLVGKVVFAQMFDGPMAKPGAPPILVTVLADDGRKVSILCDEHPADAISRHYPTIDGRAKVLTPDIQGDHRVIQVIDQPLVVP